MIELLIALALIFFSLFSGLRILIIGAFILLAVWYFRRASRDDRHNKTKKN